MSNMSELVYICMFHFDENLFQRDIFLPVKNSVDTNWPGRMVRCQFLSALLESRFDEREKTYHKKTFGEKVKIRTHPNNLFPALATVGCQVTAVAVFAIKLTWRSNDELKR